MFILFASNENSIIPLISIEFSNHTSSLIKRHFYALKLIEKYKSQIAEKLTIIVETVQLNLLKGMLSTTVRTGLESQYCILKRKYGNNYWEA